jgi:hypothetical protein
LIAIVCPPFILHANAEISAQCFQVSCKTAANGLELPFSAIAVQFSDDYRSFGREIFP